VINACIPADSPLGRTIMSCPYERSIDDDTTYEGPEDLK